ncbi:ornithine cyclodeaminase family protein [Schauerella aestuarii]|uniref:ornithine cyclodeaminase family protein n=1 Tax=Schauerella aestuarii TaxID=2511204 RepID=UPI00136DEC4B|nr:ornithine cyclodeaminase family protein [Achromobacter aestuarii]MYZ44724.1 ornithine cyclodeaminase family protein [Achromobacter aestuarii]
MTTISLPTEPTPAKATPHVSNTLLLIPAPDVLALLDRQATIDVVRQAFVQHSAGTGRVFPMIRQSVGTNAVFGIKAGDIAMHNVLGFKAAGFWPANAAVSRGAHQATIMLFDPATGRPVCLLDGNHVTTLRTGAAGAIGIDLFARQDIERVCVFGTGVQAQIHLEYALQVRPGLRSVTYITPTGEPDAAFESANTQRCRIQHAADADRAVGQADLVITATPSRTPLFSNEAVRAGTHINAVGADTVGKRELPEGLLPRASLFVDDARQSSTVGEGQWAPDCPATEIGAVIQRDIPYARAPDAITVFDMTGLALQDLVVAQMLFDRARETQRGMEIVWPW